MAGLRLFMQNNRGRMTREAGTTAPWREYLGIVITVISAVLLGLVLWQITRLGNEAALDRLTLARERVGVDVTDKIFPLQSAFDAYRRALILETPDLETKRIEAANLVGQLDAEFRSGEAAQLGIADKWKAVHDSWKKAAKLPAGPGSYKGLLPLFNNFLNLLSAAQDASNLTFDPSQAAQLIALDYVSNTTFVPTAAERLRMMVELATKNHGLTLEQRLALSSANSAVKAAGDFSSDNFPLVIKNMTELLPERADEWKKLPDYADKITSQANAFNQLVTKNVLLNPAPTTPDATIDKYASTLSATGMAMHAADKVALNANLDRRIEEVSLRSRYFYLAFLLGAMLLVGIMISIAQLVARRDRVALRQAHAESARLQAELARQEAEEALRLTEAQFKAVFDGAALGIAVIDRGGALLDANHVFRTMFGESIETALEGHESELAALLAGERDTFEFEQNVRVPGGQEIWADVTVSTVTAEGDAPLFGICMFRDKTELKHTERKIAHDKTHDALTSLPNRALFEQALRNRFDEAGALLDSFFAVLFVDLEHFKDVNESMGHAAGDLVLTQIAGRLRSSVDARDVVARLGSDEFAILVQSLGDILHVESVARRILNNLSKTVTIGTRAIYLGASVGIAIGSSSYERAEDVMRDAEIAMQHAKSTGGSRYALFDSKMHARAQKRLALVTDMRQAIDLNQFRMLYQPIVNIQDGTPEGCEALIRWDHPNEGVINPTEFIPLAEQTGLASQIGRFVLETAASQLAAWRRNRGGTINFGMHVNISATELTDHDFERTLVQLVEHHGLSPADFTLEIVESVVLDPGTRANAMLERIRDRGFKICIDDFGTGYSSMRYLQQFKVDAIKIDRSFVSGNDGEVASEPIVRTLMTLAEAFDVKVVAEGVETARQREVLRNAGCRLAQGYLYARPLSAAEMSSMYPEVLGRVNRSATA